MFNDSFEKCPLQIIIVKTITFNSKLNFTFNYNLSKEQQNNYSILEFRMFKRTTEYSIETRFKFTETFLQPSIVFSTATLQSPP